MMGRSDETTGARPGSAAFMVDDMTCNHCVGTIRKALETGMPGAAVSIDLATHVVTVGGDASRAQAIIRGAGYEPRLLALP